MTLGNDKQISVGTRIAAMLLDHLFMVMIAMAFFLPALISDIAQVFNDSPGQPAFMSINGPIEFIGLFGFALYFCKDIINGRSIAKRILKLQVVDNKTGRVATPLQCFVRDIFCVIWPIEFIVAMVNTNRRIGDRVAGTKLVPYNPTLEQPKANIGKLALPVIISYGLTILLTTITPSIKTTKTSYSQTSYNVSLSKEIEQLIKDSLGQYGIADVRVYDTVKNENLKYVSVVMKIHKNYIEDDESYRQLHSMTTSVIYSKLPKETFTGQIKYVYQGNGQYQSRATGIGTYLKSKDDK